MNFIISKKDAEKLSIQTSILFNGDFSKRDKLVTLDNLILSIQKQIIEIEHKIKMVQNFNNTSITHLILSSQQYCSRNFDYNLKKLKLMTESNKTGNQIFLSFLIKKFPEFKKELKSLSDDHDFKLFSELPNNNNVSLFLKKLNLVKKTFSTSEDLKIELNEKELTDITLYSEHTLKFHSLLLNISPTFKDVNVIDSDLMKGFKEFFDFENQDEIDKRRKELKSLELELGKIIEQSVIEIEKTKENILHGKDKHSFCEKIALFFKKLI